MSDDFAFLSYAVDQVTANYIYQMQINEISSVQAAKSAVRRLKNIEYSFQHIYGVPLREVVEKLIEEKTTQGDKNGADGATNDGTSGSNNGAEGEGEGRD